MGAHPDQFAAEREPLAEGQRIVVPRHLVPMADAQHCDELRAGRALNGRFARQAQGQQCGARQSPLGSKQRQNATGVDLPPTQV